MAQGRTNGAIAQRSDRCPAWRSGAALDKVRVPAAERQRRGARGDCRYLTDRQALTVPLRQARSRRRRILEGVST